MKKARLEAQNKAPADDTTSSVFVLTVTSFRDDYKPRHGSNWSENEKPRVFATAAKAKEALAKYLKDYINHWILERFSYEDDKHHDEDGECRNLPPFRTPARWQRTNNSWELRAGHAAHLSLLEEEIAPFIEGECVPTTLGWDIREAPIEA